MNQGCAGHHDQQFAGEMGHAVGSAEPKFTLPGLSLAWAIS
jgi:hypothetical protein